MQDTETTPTPDTAATNGDKREPLTRAFQWYPDSLEWMPGIRTLNSLRTLAYGIGSALEVVQASDLAAADMDKGPILEATQREGLVMLATEAARLACDCIDEHISWAEKHGKDACYQFATRTV